MQDRVEMTAIISANPGKSDELYRELKSLEEITCTEEGCLEFRLFEVVEDNDKFVLWEIFKDANFLKVHMDKEYTKSFFSKGLVKSTEVIKHRII